MSLFQKSVEKKYLSELNEEVINSKYTDYSAFRKSVFNNLVKNNQNKDKLLLFTKTQKLLDNVLFDVNYFSGRTIICR